MRISHVRSWTGRVMVAWMLTGGIVPVLAQETATPQVPQDPNESNQPDRVLVVKLKQMDPQAAQLIVQSLFDGKFKTAIEPRSNSLVIKARPDADFETLLATIRNLEDEAMAADNSSRDQPSGREQVLTLSLSAGAKSVDELREEYRLLEQQCFDLARRLRDQGKPADAGTDSDRTSLVELVRRAFQTRQQLQRAELADNARRLAKIQQTIAVREGLQSQIVQRRVDELLNPNVDWSKQESGALPASLASEQKTEQKTAPLPDQAGVEAEARRAEAAVRASRAADLPDLVSAKPNSAVNISDLLQTSPGQMRNTLVENASKVKQFRDNIASLQAQLALGGNEYIVRAKREELASMEATWKHYKGQLEFAELQYEEILTCLSRTLGELMEQLTTAEDHYSSMMDLFKAGRAPRTEVMAASVRPRELRMEVQRLQSLLKLYHAAGRVPELSELSRSVSKLIFAFGGAKLGQPKRIEGKGELATAHGNFTVDLAVMGNGDTVQIQLTDIPGHETGSMLLKIDVPNSHTEFWKRISPEWNGVFDVKFTDEELQAVVAGKSVRKAYWLEPDLTLREKSGDESVDVDRDSIVATIELSEWKAADQ